MQDYLRVISLLAVSIACFTFLPPSVSALSPFPASGQLAFPGHPAILDGAWIAKKGAPDPAHPHIEVMNGGQGVSQRVLEDGSLATVVYTITSYECLGYGPGSGSQSLVRYISEGNTYPGGDFVRLCSAAWVNATTMVVKSFKQASGVCPDDPRFGSGDFRADQNDTLIVAVQTFNRIEGVISEQVPVLVCTNSTRRPPAPLPSALPWTLGESEPGGLGSPSGAETAQGVWKTVQSNVQIITRDYFASAFLTEGGGVAALQGKYLTHKCLGGGVNGYVSSNKQRIIFNNETIVSGYQCEKAVRLQAASGERLQLTYASADDCNSLDYSSFNNATTVIMDLEAGVPGVVTICGGVPSAAARVQGSLFALTLAALAVLAALA